jgi:hypothetical protein
VPVPVSPHSQVESYEADYSNVYMCNLPVPLVVHTVAAQLEA